MTKQEYRCDHAAGRFGNPACAIAGRIDSLPAKTSFRRAESVPLGKNFILSRSTARHDISNQSPGKSAGFEYAQR